MPGQHCPVSCIAAHLGCARQSPVVVGDRVGTVVGLCVGDSVGLPEGAPLGADDGLPVGDVVGLAEGLVVGTSVGEVEGIRVGAGDGTSALVGADVSGVGKWVGEVVGAAVLSQHVM